MNDRSLTIAMLRRITIAASALLVIGCGDAMGPVPLRLVPVRGVVREGRRPLSGGWIEFFPVDGTVGNLRSAHIRSDGSFEAEGIAVGKNLIRLVNARIESPVAAQLFASYQSPIRRVISERVGTPIDVDLVEEAIRFRETQARQARAEPSSAGGLR
jgi:hypothetical protein